MVEDSSATTYLRQGRKKGRNPRVVGRPGAEAHVIGAAAESQPSPKDHQAARKDAIEKMEAIVSELMKVKDQDAADVVRRAAKPGLFVRY